MSNKIFLGKVFLLVTGASQGIGRKIAETLGLILEDGSQVLLLARNIDNLKETADQLPKHLTVNIESIDLSKAAAEDLEAIILKSLDTNGVNTFNEAIIIHNVGSLGDISKNTIDMPDFECWKDYYNLNVFGPAALNCVFMKIFKNNSIKKHVINITSLCAIKPIKSLGYYCSGKAAREMYFKVFAEEHRNVNVLNYSPGPVETDMLHTLTENVADLETKNNFQKQKKSGEFLTTDQTVKRFIEILSKKNYNSGDHVDYFDQL